MNLLFVVIVIFVLFSNKKEVSLFNIRTMLLLIFRSFFLFLSIFTCSFSLSARTSVTVKTVFGDDFRIELSLEDKVKDMKEQIYQEKGFPVTAQRISIGGEIFGDNHAFSTLQHAFNKKYDIFNSDTVVYVLLEGQYNESIQSSEALRKKAAICQKRLKVKKMKKKALRITIFLGIALFLTQVWRYYNKRSMGSTEV